MQSSNSSNRKYILAFFAILLAGLACMLFYTGTSLFASQALPPTTEPTRPVPPDSLAGVDDVLKQALTASIAYNAPGSMKLDETVTIELLLNPSVTEEELGHQIQESGAVTTGTIQITPLMKAELISQEGVFAITPLHDTAEQPISSTDTTRWQWQVTAQRSGTQRLTLVVYMLVRYNNKDYWREVESYKSDILVNVTLAQRLQAFPWQWLIGLIVTSGVIPALWRWLDKRRQARKTQSPTK